MTDRRLKARELLLFSGPALPLAGMGLPVVVHLPPFYADNLGLGLSAVGVVFMLTRFWDIITDPVVGALSDRVETRWGLRRHWMVLSVPFIMLSVWMMFVPTGSVSAGYLLVWMMVLYMGWTLANINITAWGSELTSSYDGRSRIHAGLQIGTVLGTVIILAIPAVMARTAQAGRAEQLEAMAWFIVLLLPVTVGLAVWRLPEHPRRTRRESLPWRQAMGFIARNVALRRVLIADLFLGFGSGVTGALFLFYSQEVLGLGQKANPLLLVFFLVGCLAIPVWTRISVRVGKDRALLANAIYKLVIIPPLLLLLPAGKLGLAFLVFAILGFGFAAGPFILRALMADITDEDSLASGQQRTGVFFALLSMTNKVGLALSVGVTYPLLDAIGFSAQGGNTEAARQGLRWLYAATPVVVNIAIIAVMLRYPLSRARHREILEQLELGASPDARPADGG